MAFDSGMVRAVVCEIAKTLNGARIEKINQPEKDEITILFHTQDGAKRLTLSASANTPRIFLSQTVKENPSVPPLFCTLLRKQLGGAKIVYVHQSGFERVIDISLSSRDEMGFTQEKHLFIEIMGRYSNLILTDDKLKIIGLLKPVDFTTSTKRQMLPGMLYEAPPKQDKTDPLTESEEGLMKKALQNRTAAVDRFITANYMGISSLTAREIAARSCDVVGEAPEKLSKEFFSLVKLIKDEDFTPTAIISPDDEKYIEYSFIPIKQYGQSAKIITAESFSALIENFYKSRDNTDRTHQRAQDLYKLISGVKAKLVKKISAQKDELSECADKDRYKRQGDLITSNMYLLKKGMTEATVTDYYSENLENVKIILNPRFTPSQNAQIHYKKYNKLKTAEKILAQQIGIAQHEIAYLDSVEDSLSRAVGASEIEEIRQELSDAGYGARIKKTSSRPQRVKPREYTTDGGYRLICGRNNTQNDEITLKSAKSDWWFHVKGAPGAHVVMVCEGEEPPAEDFTQAAALAAFNSSLSSSPLVAVDYTQVKYIKKPQGAKPGFVTYTTYWSAYVKPKDIEKE